MGRQSDYEDKNLFADDDGRRIRLHSEFFYDRLRLKAYGYEGDKHQTVIYAEYPKNSNLQRYTKTIECKRPDLLCEFLTLRGKLPDMLFAHKNMTLRDDDIGKEEINLIVEWCKLNGFPFEPNSDNQVKASSLFKKWEPNRIGFRAWDFIKRLNDVCGAYLLYCVITSDNAEDNETSFAKATYLQASQNVDYPTLFDSKNSRKIYWGMDKDECRSIFIRMYQNITFTNQIAFEKEIYLTVKANNLFDAALYQLALLLNSPSIEMSVCPLCKKIFPKEHANQVYCLTPALTSDGKRKYKKNGDIRVTCYAAKAYKREKSAKQKNANA
jgi:hypothetical protein